MPKRRKKTRKQNKNNACQLKKVWENVGGKKSLKKKN